MWAAIMSETIKPAVVVAIVIALLFLLAAGCGQAESSAEINISGLAGPVWTAASFMPFFAAAIDANDTNNTTDSQPLILSSALFWQQLHPLAWQNGTGYFHPIMAKWEQFSFYLPLPGREELPGKYGKGANATDAALNVEGNATSAEYSTTSIRQFSTHDGYYAGVEEHDDPDRMELNRFLDDDEPPNRPLL